MRKGVKISLIVLGSLVALVLIAALVLPMIFKPQILRFAQSEINKRVEARVEFADLTISLFRGFPHLYVSLDGLSVVNDEPFAGDTLVAFDRFAVTVNLMSLFDLSNIEVRSILLDHPVVNARKSAAGQVNWDIMRAADEPAEDAVVEEAGGSGSIGVSLAKFEIRNGDLCYMDDSSRLEASARGLNFTLRGDLGMARSQLDIALLIERVRFAMGGIVYAPSLELGFDATVDADLESSVFRLTDNELRLNALVLVFSGEVSLPGDSIATDLTFATRETSFKTLLSLVPAVYASSFDEIQVAGDLQLEGRVKGVMYAEELPSAELSLVVRDAAFQYPGLPRGVDGIGIDLGVLFDGRDPDASLIDLNKFAARLGENPVFVRANVRTPISDPNVTADVKAEVDLGSLHDVLPLEDMELGGHLDADIALSALLSQVTEERYEECELDGHFRLSDVVLEGVLAVPVAVETLDLQFTPRLVNLNALQARAGASDVALSGGLSNFLPFLMSDGVLEGRLALRSQLLDLNELFPTAEEEEDVVDSVDAADSVVDLSLLRRVSFAFDSKIGRVNFQKMELGSVVGNFSLLGSMLSLRDISCEMLGGSARIAGLFDFRREDVNELELAAHLSHIDVRQSVNTFTTLERLLPTLKYVEGNVSMNFDVELSLSPAFSLILPTLQAKGAIRNSTLSVSGSPLFTQLGAIFKDDNLAKPTLSPTVMPFTIRDGMLTMEPFTVSIAGVQSDVSGTVGLDQTIDFGFGMQVPSSKLGGASDAVNSVLSKLSPDVKLGETVPVVICATGQATSPRLSVRVAEDVKGQVQGVITQKVEEVKEQVQERVGAEVDKLLAEAQKQAENIVATAAVAAEKVRSEARVQADNLVAEAKKKGRLAEVAARKAADKMVEEADRKAAGIEQEARVQADAILSKAQDEASKLQR